MDPQTRALAKLGIPPPPQSYLSTARKALAGSGAIKKGQSHPGAGGGIPGIGKEGLAGLFAGAV